MGGPRRVLLLRVNGTGSCEFLRDKIVWGNSGFNDAEFREKKYLWTILEKSRILQLYKLSGEKWLTILFCCWNVPISFSALKL